MKKLNIYDLKGSVQRKLKWVKNIANGGVLASDRGAGHYFVFFCAAILY